MALFVGPTFRNLSGRVFRRAVFTALCWTAACSVSLAQRTQADETWRTEVEETISATCAMRGLELKSPLKVLPMVDFQGGYTKGIGSAVWDTDYARIWREGWCALGVYCAQPEERQDNDDGHAENLARPRGLYDSTQNTLFLSGFQAEAFKGTIAHETLHALQFQNFPELNAAHLWRNRDLAAAVNAVIEGDAGLIGSSLVPSERLLYCSMDPVNVPLTRAKLWQWQPNGMTALEAFPHVFGPELTLQEMLARGPTAMDRLLREPPLSTLAVLQPELADMETEFIRLPSDLEVNGCTEGLRNTAGVVGIWGLLRQHGDSEASGEEWPPFLEHWRGDRFLHLSCPGEQEDEFVWVTHWNSAEAAATFAQRYGAIAKALPPTVVSWAACPNRLSMVW